MARMQELDPELRAFLQMYKWHQLDLIPWARMPRPLTEARVGLVVTACMTTDDQPPFDAEKPGNDPSLRIIPSEMNPAELVNTYPGQNFDHAGLQADANLLIPLDRLREMEASGEIGEFAPEVVSLCGHLPKPKALIEETAPEVARIFLEDGVRAAILVPA